jgi:hypothetical protein
MTETLFSADSKAELYNETSVIKTNNTSNTSDIGIKYDMTSGEQDIVNITEIPYFSNDTLFTNIEESSTIILDETSDDNASQTTAIPSTTRIRTTKTVSGTTRDTTVEKETERIKTSTVKIITITDALEQATPSVLSTITTVSIKTLNVDNNYTDVNFIENMTNIILTTDTILDIFPAQTGTFFLSTDIKIK